MITVRDKEFASYEDALKYVNKRLDALEERTHELLHDMVYVEENPHMRDEVQRIATKWIEFSAGEVAQK